MKNTGIVRRLDELGRITLPIELRRVQDIENRGAVEIFIDDQNRIVLQKYEPKKCTFCESTSNITQFKEKYVCDICKKELVE